MKNFLEIKKLTRNEILDLIKKTIDIKKKPRKYQDKLKNKTLLLFFEAPSLRTRVSFEAGMNQLGGSAIYYDISTSPLGKGKETIEDTAKVISRYCDIAALRIYSHEDLLKFAYSSRIPVVNMMTNEEHPFQIIGDLFTIFEKKKKLNDISICYLGDSNNNVTNSLIYACSILNIKLNIGCPSQKEFNVRDDVLKNAIKLSNNKNLIKIFNDPLKAAKQVNVIYTDSWMSYRIPKNQEARRTKILRPYQVNEKLMKYADKNALFMHCLPALRGQEVTKEVIDGKNSIVWTQAENRLHMQKTIMLKLLGRL
ncbi:ornithine carbamoyltransferase [Candidatus Woesearchaeota archaeon]|nr:ornithine carbamoyltransferase [Candidatus Woesearchaeota archaeon]